MNAIANLSDNELRKLSQRGYGLAFRMLGHRDDAADVVQDALHQLFSTSQRFDGRRGNLSAWFLRIVRNRAIDTKRRRVPQAAGESFDPVETATDSPERLAQQTEERKQVQAALAQLDEDAREIVLLRDFDGCTYAEIARILDIRAGTVMSRLHRARMKLCSFLQNLQADNTPPDPPLKPLNVTSAHPRNKS